ncbi:hypothetical protein [Polynucleobacter sp.]|uniref:hypothetical protein n=1 Tax=Polynucleobacter sp. TaxID=2029855 RepID=UPI003F6A48CE
MSLEHVYLAIIILFLASRVIQPIIKVRQIYKLFGYKRIYIKGHALVIRKLSPLDFIDEDNGFPMGIFEHKKGLTMFEKLTPERERKETPEQIQKRVQMAKTICKKGVVHWPGALTVDDFFADKVSLEIADIAFQVTNAVLDYNFTYIKNVLKINKALVIHTAELCAKLGQKPHKHLAANKKLSDLEAYLIDEFFYNTLLEKLNAEIERQNKGR